MIKFLFLPAPLPEESPSSMLRRMALRHGCSSISDFTQLIGARYPCSAVINRSHLIVQRITEQAGPAAAEFLSGLYEDIGALPSLPPLKIAGFIFVGDLIRRSKNAFCSECWSTGKEYYFKDLKLFSSCPIHYRQYLSSCPACGARLTWFSGLDGNCACGAVLTSPPCNPEQNEVERKLLEILRSGNADTLDRFLDILRHLGYRLQNDTPCPLNRSLLELGCAILNRNATKIVQHLFTLAKLFPHVPPKIISATMAGLTDPVIRGCAASFLKSSLAAAPARQFECQLATAASFSLSMKQLRAWLAIKPSEWKFIKSSAGIKDRTSKYSWEQANIISQVVLNHKLDNRSNKKKIRAEHEGITLHEIQQKLMISLHGIRELIKTNNLNPVMNDHQKYVFNDEDIKEFSLKYVSIRRLSAESGFSTSKIRLAIRRLDLPALSYSDCTTRFQMVPTDTCDRILYWCSKEILKKPLSPRKKYKATDLLTHGTNWLTKFEAGQRIGLCPSRLHCLMKHNFFSYRKFTPGQKIYVDAFSLAEFNSRYINATEARNILGCGIKAVRCTLKNLGIPATICPTNRNGGIYLYPREELLRYALTVKLKNHDRTQGYTIKEACRKLHTDHVTISTLIKNEKLPLIKRIISTPKLIEKEAIDSFYDTYAKQTTISHWLGIPRSYACRFLCELGISPVSGPSVNSARIPLFEISDINLKLGTHYSTSGPQAAAPSLFSISQILSKYQISGNDFNRNFLRTKFVKAFKTSKKTFLLKDDYLKIERILDAHLTIPQATRYLGIKCHRLVKAGQFKLSYPINDRIDLPMLSKSDLVIYAAKYDLNKT